MWHTIKFVAEAQRLDAKELTAFAVAGQSKYGVIVERGEAEVSTGNVDALVADFKEAARC